MGNFSRFIRPGFVRTEVSTPYTDIYNLGSVAFTGQNELGQKELVIVLTNEEDEKTFRLDLNTINKYDYCEVYTTTEEKDLEMTFSGDYDSDTAFTIEGKSIVTIRLIER